MCFAPQRRALFRHLNVKKWSEHGVFCTFWLGHMLRATTVYTFSTSQLPKLVRSWCVLYILTWTYASCHNGVHFFDISTSKIGPELVCFVHFDLEMCFAPQRCALFRHLNFQKWSERDVLLPFLLTNVLRATTACNFSSLIWPAGSAPAALARLLFDPPEPQVIGKAQWTATSLPFRAPASSLFWLSPSLIFSLLDFSVLTLPTSAFPSLHIVGSLTSKLPSANIYQPFTNSYQQLLPVSNHLPTFTRTLPTFTNHLPTFTHSLQVFRNHLATFTNHVPTVTNIYQPCTNSYQQFPTFANHVTTVTKSYKQFPNMYQQSPTVTIIHQPCAKSCQQLPNSYQQLPTMCQQLPTGTNI